MKFAPGLKFEDAIVQERIGAFLDADIHLISSGDERHTKPHVQWKFRCNVCRCVIPGIYGAQNHMEGHRHKQGEFVESKYKIKNNKMKDSTGSNKDDKEDSEELWDEETNEEINPSSVKTDEEKYDPSNPTSSTQSNLPSVPIPGKTQVPKAAYPYLTMQEKLTSLVEPIVGLENVVEHHIETGDMPPYYECQLCKSDMADANLINHLKGRGHRMNYIQTKNVEKYGSITNLPSYNVGKAMLDTIKEMEEEFGRGFMPIVIDKDGKFDGTLLLMNHIKLMMKQENKKYEMKFAPGLKFEDAIVQERIGAFLDADIHLISSGDERHTKPHVQWKFRCNVCRCVIPGIYGAQNHMEGHRHKQGEFVESKYKIKNNKMKDSTGSNKDDKEDSEELWDEETNEEINPSSVKTDEEKYDPSNPTSSTQSNLPSVPIPGKTQVPKAAYPYLTMQEKLTSLVEPIVGLENVVEHHIETGDMPPYYECQLCKSDMADANLINHLKGRGHRMNYIQTKNVEKYGSITNLPSYNVGKAMLDTIKEMEEEFGRGFMPIVIDKDVLKHPDSKNYQVHREKMKENEKNTQKRSFGQSDNTFNNKERKKKRGIIGKNENKGNITIGKGPISSTSLKRNNANNWPTNNFNNMNQNYNMQGWSQEQMYYYQNQYYQGFGQMGNNNYNMLNASKPIGSIPPINPELCPTPTNIGQVNQPILGQIPSDNKPILGEAPDNAPLLGTAPMGHQPMLGGAPMNSNMNMGVNSMNPMMAQNFMNPMMNQMMGQNPMNNMNQMMGQNSMNNMMGQSNINPIMLQSNNMHGQSNMNPMMNQGSMMGQGISISNMGMNLMNSISHSSMNNPMSQQPLSMNVTQGNFNSNLSQTALNPLDNLNFNMRQGFSNDNNLSENSQISNSTSISTGLSSTTQTPSVNGQNNSIEQNSTNHSLDPQVSQVKVNQELDCNLDSNTFITATISALLETPKSKTEFGDSLLGPPPSNGKQNAPLLKETNRESLLDTPSSGPTQYNFSSSKEENIPLLGSDGQLTQSEAAKKMDEIRSQRGILLDALATWEIKSDEEASAAMKVINRLTQSLTTYKLKNTTSSVKSVLLNSVTGAKEVEDLLGLQQK